MPFSRYKFNACNVVSRLFVVPFMFPENGANAIGLNLIDITMYRMKSTGMQQ